MVRLAVEYNTSGVGTRSMKLGAAFQLQGKTNDPFGMTAERASANH